MILIFTFIFFVLGLIIGSFLNVVVYRLNTKKSLGGRSACMSCRNRLSWYELIPLFSFLGLKGRCRNCRTKISMQYPLVEFLSGLIFAAIFWKFQNLFSRDISVFTAYYIFYACVFSILLVIAAYDMRHKIIPDILSLLLGIAAFFSLFFFNIDGPLVAWHLPSVMELLSGPLIAFPFFFFWLVSGGRWMGLGDAKLALGLGWLLGLSAALSGLVIAFWTGAIVGVSIMVFSKKYGMKSEIPFAPYLALGAGVAFFFGLNFFSIYF